MTHPAPLYPVPERWASAGVDADALATMTDAAAADPQAFWLEQAKRLDWTSAPTVAGDWSFDADDFRINWFADGTLNVSANCLDRHLDDARRYRRDHLGTRRPRRRRAPHHLSRTPCRGVPLRQRAQEPGRREGRPRHALSADDPRGGVRGARLRADRARSIRSSSAASRPRRIAGRIDRLRQHASSSPRTRGDAAASASR